MTILDQDLDMYIGFAENHVHCLRNCPSDAEAEHRAMRDAARAVVAALTAYKAVLAAYED
jgi:hypothetical protein